MAIGVAEFIEELDFGIAPILITGQQQSPQPPSVRSGQGQP